MDSSLQCLLCVLLVLVVKAEEEPFLGQREVLFDLSDLEDEDFMQKPSLQKPVVFISTDFSDPDTEILQKPVFPDLPDFLRETDGLPAGPPRFAPRSIGPPQIPFPLARPNRNNVRAICLYSNQRPRYPKEMLPQSGFGHIFRQAIAVNQLESFFSVCCSSGFEDEELLLCCMEQAWKSSLSAFCDEEFSVKTSHYHCCKKEKSAKWNCFEKDASDRSYQPNGSGSWADIPLMTDNFNFNPETCQKQRSQVSPKAMKGKQIGSLDVFPPGRPYSSNIDSICTNNQQRRQYVSKCLANKGQSRLVLQSKAISDLEKGFNQCCKKKKDKQACAEMKWKMMVDDFCAKKKATVGKQFDCCKKEKGEEQYNCFAAAAPNPDYVLSIDGASPNEERPTLDKFCDMYRTYHTTERAIDNSWHIPSEEMAKQCCPHMEEENPACLQTQMSNIVAKACSDSLWRQHKCCKLNDKSRNKCATKLVLRNLSESLGLKYKKYKCSVF